MSDFMEVYPGEEFYFKVLDRKTNSVIRKHKIVIKKMGGLKRYDL